MNLFAQLTGLPGFDLADGLDRFGGDHGKFCKYVLLMIADFRTRLPLVQEALGKGDFLSACAQLHTLAGTASALSATELGRLCHSCMVNCTNTFAWEAAQDICQMEQFLESIPNQLQLQGYNQQVDAHLVNAFPAK